MKLTSYEYRVNTIQDNWRFNKFELDNINLLAGLSSVGKTRVLNTINNLSLIIQRKRPMGSGHWVLEFRIKNKPYRYELDIGYNEKKKQAFIRKEELLKNNDKVIFIRNSKAFIFKGNKLPKLSVSDLGLTLLREEKEVAPIYSGFCKIYIRRHNPQYFSPLDESQIGGIPKDSLMDDARLYTPEYIHSTFKDVSTQLYFLEINHPKIYTKIKDSYTEIFPFVKDISIEPFNEIEGIQQTNIPPDLFVPVILIKETGIKKPIPIYNISAGMMRAIIQLIDIYTMPKGSIYLIDELENSMGVKSLPAMIDIILELSSDIQYIFTTHHAYIFNNVPIKYWRILSRKGPKVTITSGKELESRFKDSYQDAYIQLINSELIESGI
ncbi:MAG: AAA family ATPase [Candidatus Thorarchaeota archaeon]|jgi:hypothetical protein